jgi:dipeptidyl aminopeptidase/acylaminoacyl peptidase
MDANGSRIAFSVEAPKEVDGALQEARNRYGFRVSPGEPIDDTSQIRNWFPNSYLYMAERGAVGELKVTRLQPIGPLGKPLELFNGEVAYLSLSPNGRFLVFQYADKIPDAWNDGFYALELQSGAYPPPFWGLLDIEANRLQIGFDAPAYALVPPVWSDDSRAFAVSALPPEGSSWEKQDFADGFLHLAQMNSYMHLFAVDAKTRLVSEVLHRYTGVGSGNISWNKTDGVMSIPLDGGIVARFEHLSEGWREVSRKTVFVEPGVILQSISGDGHTAIGVREDVTTPPNLVFRDLTNNQTHVLTDLNPQFRETPFGDVDKINWVNKFGVKCWGYLIKPVGYNKNIRYPLVMMNISREHFFVSDGSYTTAFPPQPLASNGFAVLMVDYYFDFKDLPKGFPGRLAEAYNWMAMVESGVDYLADNGVVDRTKVGIIGFSRTSWKTDFMLTHSGFKFAAASSADSGLYNYGAYWIYGHGLMADAEKMMGGPPYGATFENWLKYAPAFNAQHVQSPLLMEYTGSGHMPHGPTDAYEFFTALYRQNKPVELYFYPLGDHPLDTPSERVASLQRNVDWFRFWIQGYEGKAPDYDPDQYVRWRTLRKQQEESQGKADSTSARD